jgi:hypothetical protein
LRSVAFASRRGEASRKGPALFVGNTDRGSVLQIPVRDDGSAGRPRLYAQDADMVGADGLAWDVQSNLYVTTDGLGHSRPG